MKVGWIEIEQRYQAVSWTSSMCALCIRSYWVADSITVFYFQHTRFDFPVCEPNQFGHVFGAANYNNNVLIICEKRTKCLLYAVSVGSFTVFEKSCSDTREYSRKLLCFLCEHCEISVKTDTQLPVCTRPLSHITAWFFLNIFFMWKCVILVMQVVPDTHLPSTLS